MKKTESLLILDPITLSGSKNSKQVLVRECSEIEKGEFQAYVDQKGESYDVFLKINSKGEVLEHTCDCPKNGSFCEHKKALMEFISKPKLGTEKKKREKKKSPTEVLLDQIDYQDLKKWIGETLLKNKELEISFHQNFGNPVKEYIPEEVRDITMQVVKALVKNKKILAGAEVKKIVDLWEEVHEPVMKHYYTYIDNEEAFQCFHAVIETCQFYDYKFRTTSKRITQYIEKRVSEASRALYQQKDDILWAKSLSYFTKNLFAAYDGLNIHYLILISGMEDHASRERLEKYAQVLLETYLGLKKNSMNSSAMASFTVKVLDALESTDQLEKHLHQFQPIPHENDLNQRLIKGLIQLGEYSKAESMCLKQIELNYSERYNKPYLEFLKQIYQFTQNDKSLLMIQKDLFSMDMSFDLYREIERLSTDKIQFLEFRNQTLALARGMAVRGKKEGMNFSIQLMGHEKKYEKMLEYMDSSTDLNLILQFSDVLFQVNKIEFMKKILFLSGFQEHISEYNFRHFHEYTRSMKTKIQVHFTKPEIQDMIRELKMKGKQILSSKFCDELLKG